MQKITYNPKRDYWFRRGCDLDHVFQINELMSDESIERAKRLRTINNENALDYLKRIITNHQQCLKENHEW